MAAQDSSTIWETLDELAQTIAHMFGPDCEVCVNDLKDGVGVVKHIYNGHVTNRSVGTRLTDEARMRVKDGLAGTYINYSKLSKPSKKLLKSSTIVKKIGDVYFSFCINYDVTNLETLHTSINSFLNVTNMYDDSDFFEGSTDADFRKILNENLQTLHKSVATLTRKERVGIVADYYARGFLRMKGSVQLIANLLVITRATVYNYLREIQAGQAHEPTENQEG